MKSKHIILFIIAQLILNFNTNAQYKFYNEKDSIEFHHYKMIISKGYSVSIENGKLTRKLVDSTYLDSDKFIPFDSALKLSHAIPKFSYSKHQANQEFTSIKELLQKRQYDSITHLSIEGEEFTRFPTLKIIKCKNLQEVELIGTAIKKIPWILNWNIVGLDSLKTICVYNHARGKTIKFKKNNTIEEVVFRDNPYSPVPIGLHKLKGLKEIDLVRNDFPEDSKFHLEKYKNLEKINLSKNNVRIENLANDTVKKLSNIILSFNNIEMVPEEIGYFKNLNELQLAENKIKSEHINPAVGTLDKLTSLSFYKNELDSLPPFIFNLSSLRELDLYFNKISILPDEIGNLTNLERLYIAHNKFYSVPESVGKLKFLKELYIHHNRISYLPESIENLEYITDFHVQNNYFQGFPSFVLGYKYLEDLDISHNNIQKIPTGLLELKHLKLLWMKGLTFAASNREEAKEIKYTIETLQKKGVKVSIDLE